MESALGKIPVNVNIKDNTMIISKKKSAINKEE